MISFDVSFFHSLIKCPMLILFFAQQPSYAPVIPIRANTITILRNVPERYLTPRELEKFLEIALTFLRRHTEDSMTIESLELYHQKLMKVDAVSCGVTPTEVLSPQKQARAFVTEGESDKKLLKKDGNKCQVWGMEVTLIAKVSFAFLPHNLLGSMAAVAFENHEQEFLDLLHEQQAFYTFFKIMDGISAVGVDELTPPPTESPTTYAYFLEQQKVLIDENVTITEDTDTGLGFGVFVGLGIGFLWCCLTAISIAYLMNARGEMEEQRDLENLLNAEKDPVKSVGRAKGNISKKKSDLTESSNSTDSDSDEPKNPRINARTRAKLSQSVNATRTREVEEVSTRRVSSNNNDMKKVQFKGNTGQRPMAQSVVVTKIENRAILGKDKNVATKPHSQSAVITKYESQELFSESAPELRKSSTRKPHSQSIVITNSDNQSLNRSAPDLRKSSTKKKSSTGSRKLSQSINQASLEESLARNDQKALKRSVRSSMKGSDSLKRSSTGSSGKSSRGSSKDSLRRSSTSDSSENLRKLRASSKGSSTSSPYRDDSRLRHSEKGGANQRRSASKAMRSQSMIT